jgi:ADP-dependent NAD(P)H-hydrate dehydratase / NAD(P)H-hydrate epimerase
MSHQFCRILSSAQLRALEAGWIQEAYPHWGLVLMEVAGLAAAQFAATMYDGSGGVTVVCGRGNNGGDGLVVARHLQRWQIPVSVFMVEGASGGAETEASINQKVLEKTGLQIHYISPNDTEPMRSALSGSALIIDALLGTGLDRLVEGVYAQAINLINNSHETVLSLDIPSGINSDTGQVMGVAVEADATVTFGHLKAGLLQYPGADHAGDVVLVDIGLPSWNGQGGHQQWWLATFQDVLEWIPPRKADAHKGTMGRLLCVAGSSSMTGAAMMAARSSLRTGVGISVLATPKSVIPSLPPEEIIYRSLPETAFGTIAPAALSELETEFEQASALLLGPGLSTNVETIKFVHDFVKQLKKPAIIDADALNALAQDKSLSFGSPADMVFTPHPKELSRLLGISVGDIQSDRLGVAERARDKFGCTIVLKGARTVVATVDGASYIIPCGNPGMATAGSGDVLSGIIGALLAEGLSASHAAVAGAYIHAAAGDLAAFSHGEDGMVASNIMDAIPVVLADLRSDEFTGTELEQMVLSL